VAPCHDCLIPDGSSATDTKAFLNHDAEAARAELRHDLMHPNALSRYGDAAGQ
jgi:hypothetical protein